MRVIKNFTSCHTLHVETGEIISPRESELFFSHQKFQFSVVNNLEKFSTSKSSCFLLKVFGSDKQKSIRKLKNLSRCVSDDEEKCGKLETIRWVSHSLFTLLLLFLCSTACCLSVMIKRRFYHHFSLFSDVDSDPFLVGDVRAASAEPREGEHEISEFLPSQSDLIRRVTH